MTDLEYVCDVEACNNVAVTTTDGWRTCRDCWRAWTGSDLQRMKSRAVRQHNGRSIHDPMTDAEIESMDAVREALPPATLRADLSPADRACATDAIATAVRQFSGLRLLSDDVNNFHEQLRLRGLAIVRVKGGE
jgi:hypothetical protein